MSRSYRKHPIMGNCSHSEKEDKRINNRCLRHRVKQIIHVNPEADVLPIMGEVSNPWDMAKDGKHYFGHMLKGSGYSFPHTLCKDDPYWIRLYRKCMSK